MNQLQHHYSLAGSPGKQSQQEVDHNIRFASKYSVLNAQVEQQFGWVHSSLYTGTTNHQCAPAL
jgi:hypothetical protein